MVSGARAWCALVGASVAIVACGGGDRDRAPATSPFGRGTEVSYATRDGVKISATLRLPPDAERRPVPAVVLVHQLGGDRTDFNALLPALHRAGYATLAYDIRGTGRSNGMADGTVFRPGTDRAAYLATMPRDVTAAVQFLRRRRGIDGRRIAVVGSSLAPTSRSPPANCPARPPPLSRSRRSQPRSRAATATGAATPAACC